jgi:TRAP-type C4-dicarboxylate transport system substrate-binding protein
MRRQRVVLSLAPLAILAIVAAACTSGGGRQDKAGGGGEPIVLRLSNGYSSLDYEPAVAYFVDRVEKLSGGALRIGVVHERGRNSEPGFEQDIVRDVQEGKVDLAWIGTRVFDTLGVKSFQALSAPMLIDSYPLEGAVIASDIPERMLGALDSLGVTGLAVLADGLRKPIAVGRPLLGPADWQGVTFAAFRSDGQAGAIRALGASPSELWGAPLVRGLAHDEVQGFEKSVLIYHLGSLETVAPYVTANVNLWPQTVALVVNPARLSALSGDQQRWVRQAAKDAAQHSTSLVSEESGLVSTECGVGARFADASAADLAALRQAFAPVYAGLATDPQTKAFVEAIEALKRSTPAGPALAIPEGCTGAAPGHTLLAGEDDPSVLNGVYRVQWTEDELFAAGPNRVYAHANYGVITITFQDGHYVIQPGDRGPPCSGSYSVSGNVVFLGETDNCVGTVTANWSLGHGVLRFSNVDATDAGDEVTFGGKPWTKIAEIPRSPRIPDGVYRITVSREDLLSAGVLPSEAAANGGTHTLTVRGEEWTWHAELESAPAGGCTVTVSYSGERVSFSMNVAPNCGRTEWTAVWTFSNGELGFTDIQPDDVLYEALFGSEPWTKIG